ncbi:PfkB family carbohydrate kinase [Thaumasiovibrio sp. DFM-14]|uniref:PfkB family carbohydrate kinase n=1 Tax=Thaumasiovibrio sp. DFM-14 TaxID=3384792 RepID=UPI0039A15C45
MNTVICIGNATWDQTFSVSATQMAATKCYAQAFSVNGGGVAATAAVAIADAGESVEFIGRIGQDMVGTQITKELEAHGVNISHCLCYPHAQSSIATIILSDDQSLKNYIYNDPNMPKDTSSLFDIDLTHVSAIVADLTWPEGAKVLFERAKQHGIPSFLRVSFFDNTLIELFELADCCVFNHPSLLAMTSDINHRKALTKATRRVGGSAVVTLAQRGCAWLYNDTYGQLPTEEINIVDTTGAGDIFIGILAMLIGKGVEVEKSLATANHIATLSCEFMGARQLSQSPQAQEILKAAR